MLHYSFQVLGKHILLYVDTLLHTMPGLCGAGPFLGATTRGTSGVGESNLLPSNEHVECNSLTIARETNAFST